MPIAESIQTDFIKAMKEKNELELSVLRLIRSALKNKQIDAGHELSDDESLQVLKTQKKQLDDALADFEKAGREDLITKQKAELEILKRYMPEQMPQEEVERIVREALESAGDDAGDFGKAMGIAMKAVAGRADGTVVREIVQRLQQDATN